MEMEWECQLQLKVKLRKVDSGFEIWKSFEIETQSLEAVSLLPLPLYDIQAAGFEIHALPFYTVSFTITLLMKAN